MDLNEELVAKCLEVMNIEGINMGRTEEYTPVPKGEPIFMPKDYYQVFKAKNGFLPDLSIIDLIFNMGPESILYLKR